MQRLIQPFNNERGYFLIISTIMLLALITIISIAASNTARTEVQTAGNDLTYQRNLYLAEGAAMEAVDQLQNDPNPRGLPFVESALKVIDDNNFWVDWEANSQAEQRRWIPAAKPVSGPATRERLRVFHWEWASPGCMDLPFTAALKNRAKPPSRSGIEEPFSMH